MKEQSLVDLFELYDQAFDEVCDELNVTEKPTWQHKWFYRYYQINLIPQLVGIIENSDTSKDLPELLENLKKHGDFEDFVLTAQKYYCNSGESFTQWWFTKAKNFFANSKDKARGITTIKFNEEIDDEELKYWLKCFYLDMREIYNKKYRADHLFISVPIRGSKKETMDLIENYLDGLPSFQGSESIFWRRKNPYEITKNKIPIKTIKDCYRLLEYISYHPEERDLVKIAKDSRILKISRANLDTDRKEDSLNSIRSGTSRLMILALELLTGAAYGFFPSPIKRPSEFYEWDPFFYILEVFPNLTSSFLFESARKNIPSPEEMKHEIKKEMLDLAEKGVLN